LYHQILYLLILIVFKKSQLVEILGIKTRQHLFKECLPYVAFTYSNGPYKDLWIRFNYNVTKDPMNRIYQTINVRFQQQFLQTMSDKLVNQLGGRDRLVNKTIDIAMMVIKDAPEEFMHRFIDKGTNARLPLSLFGYVLKLQVQFQVSGGKKNII
jgi:hypothetical protein